MGEPVDYPGRAAALGALIAAEAPAAEAAGRLTEPVVTALVEAGLLRLLLPAALGGAEVDPMTFMRTTEAVAQADASTAWVLCQLSGCSMMAAYLAPPVAREIFSESPPGLMAWGAGPAGRAVTAPGGYRVTGSWGFASGSRHATWLGAHCPVVDPAGTPRCRTDGSAEVRTMLFPADRATLAGDWQVMGLRATGSESYRVADLFVPEAYSGIRDEPGERRQPGALYCFTTSHLYGSGFAGVALGTTRALLDALVTLARDKTPRGLDRTLAESAVFQSRLAQAEARWRAARAYLLATLAEAWEDAGRVGPAGRLSLEQRARVRLSTVHASHEAVAVADWAYHTAGGTAIFQAGAFERRFRDIHAVSQQVQGRHTHYETVGRVLAGLEPGVGAL